MRVKIQTLVFVSVALSVSLMLAGCGGGGGGSAADYGITDPGKAVLVVQDESGPFHIKGVSIRNTSTGHSQSLGSGEGVFAILPGSYMLTVRYGDGRCGAFYVSDTVSASFEVGPGEAVVYSLKGGRDISCTTYDPAELNRE